MSELRPTVHGLVTEDIKQGLSHYFTVRTIRFVRPTEQAQGALENARVAALAWEADCVDDHEFPDLEPSHQEFAVEGVTIVEMANGTPMFRRYVDWNRIIGQLGETQHRRATAEPTAFTKRR